MASKVFSGYLPVVDRIPQQDCHVILRSRTREDMLRKVRRLQEGLTVKDLIKVWPVGQRPDRPVPVPAFFTEVIVRIGGAEGWEPLGQFPGWLLYRGKRKNQAQIIF